MFSFFKSKKNVEEKTVELNRVEEFDDIKLIADYFHKETGITFDSQMSILKNKVVAFCKNREIFSFKDLLIQIESNKDVKQAIIDHLTTNETFFYRELTQIKELVKLVKNSSGTVSILCAPSATGEEPYSIAIALIEEGCISFNITGIDINSEAIAKAKMATYGERNVRNLSEDIKKRYFMLQEQKYVLKESVKSHVTFKIANLFESSFTSLGKFDFIFSRNMLIYFDKETKLEAKRILENMRKTQEYNVFFGHADLF
ncbi:MAG: protein-glutamate O-methyltransferase CheR [Helicobacteraceae bacterium]|nr:protein-glutamate O-methyltransferase CheR [Helicobacteraceae bacterium]